HTRSKRDWSSDVCSSDLGAIRSSDDGKTWSPPGAPEDAAAEHVFKTSGRHRWWMLWITRLTRTPGIGESGNAFGVGINEIQPSEIGRASCREGGWIWAAA